MPATFEQPVKPADHTKAEPVAAEAAPVTGHDIRRIAPCAAKDPTRFAIDRIEIGPLGVAATDGKVLCLLNRPGRPQRIYVDAAQTKSVPKKSLMAVNGQVDFVSQGAGPEMRARIGHVGPDDARFPDIKRVVPEAANLVPIGVFEIAELKKLLSALQAGGDSKVSVFARQDTHTGPCVLGNEHGDMGLIMPIVSRNNPDDPGDFPTAIYEALGKGTQIGLPLGRAKSE